MTNPNGGRLYVDTFCLSAFFVLRDLVVGIYIESYADEFYITQEEFDGAKIKYHECNGYAGYIIEFPIKYCHWDDSRFNHGLNLGYASSRVDDMAIELSLHNNRERMVEKERAESNNKPRSTCMGINCPEYISKWGPEEEEFYQTWYYANDDLRRYLTHRRNQAQNHGCCGCINGCGC